ncbi:Protein HGV2 [Halotydeus destructor]|nr:Protein HGV2 [Halotydeus destructor]
MTEQTVIPVADPKNDAEGQAKSPEIKDAVNFVVQGKRHMLIHDYNSAVTSFEQACQIYDSLYGTGADETAEVYLCYGEALLEVHRQETGALDGGVVQAAMQESSDDEDEEEGDEEEEEEENGEEDGDAEKQQEETKLAEEELQNSDEESTVKLLAAEGSSSKAVAGGSSSTSVTAESSSSTTTAGGSGSGNSEGSGSVASLAGPAANGHKEEPVAGSSSGVTEEAKEPAEDEDAEPSSAEIAWEVLGLARDAFKRQSEKGDEYKVKLASALQSMGEISIEWENYENAISILEESLSLRKEALAEDDRLIAETYYHIGVCFSFQNEVERANDCYRCAVGVIEHRLKNLKGAIASSEANPEKTAKELEVIELENLLPDMQAKIEDSNDQMHTVKEALKQEITEKLKEEAVTAKVSPKKPVNNISHLVKRKREDGSGESAAKKLATETSTV